MTTPSRAQLDIGDALFDSIRLHVSGDVQLAGLVGIPAVKRDPILACGFLTSMIATAVRAYADAVGVEPVAAVDLIWSKPPREADR